MDEKEKRLQEAREFAKRVLEKYGNLVKSIVLMGSVVRGEFKPESDIDIIVILDDTIEELSGDKLEAIDDDLEKMAKSISDKISIQPSYTLTEFVDYAKSGHPIVYNFIKEGEPLFDAGFFMPWKRLLKLGKIQGTREAIENYMEDAPKKLARAKTVKLLMLAEDCYYAMVNSAQAVLMFMGLEPPVPSKLYEEVMEYLVKPGLLEEEYAKWLKEIVQIRKDIEHKKLLEVKGEFVDQWIERAEKYVEKMFNLLNALEIRKKEKILERTHEVMIKAAATAIKALHKLPENMQIDELEKHLGISIRDAFKRDFIDSKRIEGYYFDIWKRIEELKKEVIDEKKFEKLKGNEVEQLREYVRKLIHELSRTLKEEGKNIENG
ncbi:MAG: nucleotidyltransferase domain-containing protein [Candidatus Aenigmatarchaeota archaeon]